MKIKKYQVRIRKPITEGQVYASALAAFGDGFAMSEIRALNGNFESIQDAVEKINNVPEMKGYEIISIILVDTDNSEQLGEDFNWGDEDNSEE